MKKIPSLFLREWNGNRLAYNECTPGTEWVQRGEGVATIKYDGTACMVKDGRLYKRYDRKRGKPEPLGWIPCEETPDPNSGHWPGWCFVGKNSNEKWHLEAWKLAEECLEDGTYELVGPKVQGNPYGISRHHLLRHGSDTLPDAPTTFKELATYLKAKNIEGIVWHHPDGRMVKIKRRDFGLPWPIK